MGSKRANCETSEGLAFATRYEGGVTIKQGSSSTRYFVLVLLAIRKEGEARRGHGDTHPCPSDVLQFHDIKFQGSSRI